MAVGWCTSGSPTKMIIPQLDRDSLAAHRVQVVREGHRTRPEIISIHIAGSDLVVKDYRNGKSLFGLLLSRFLTAREWAAYQRLDGLAGVPHCYGRLDPYALVVEHVPSHRAMDLTANHVPPDFFDRLAELVESLHRRGLAHGDLHKLDNILIDDHGHPVIVDFTSALISGSNPLVALLFPLLRDDDWRGVYKLKQKVATHLLTKSERDFLEKRSRCERVFRCLREPVRRFIQRSATAPDCPANSGEPDSPS